AAGAAPLRGRRRPDRGDGALSLSPAGPRHRPAQHSGGRSFGDALRVWNDLGERFLISTGHEPCTLAFCAFRFPSSSPFAVPHAPSGAPGWGEAAFTPLR